MKADFELEKVVETINKQKANRVCVQFPDGLKPKAKEIQEKIEEKTNAEVFIWAGSCFGSCDIPFGLEEMNVDLLVQWGHSG
ncbi:MAG: diphthamide synthesis protein [Candidatus Nanoarchaeia archaeon]